MQKQEGPNKTPASKTSKQTSQTAKLEANNSKQQYNKATNTQYQSIAN